MKKRSLLILAVIGVLGTGSGAAAQFPIKLPKVPKVETPKQEQPKGSGGQPSQPSSGGSSAPHAEQLAAFALLAMAPVPSTELRIDFQTDNSSCFLCGSRERYDAAGFVTTNRYAKGPQASPIAAGLFDIDALIQAPQ